MLSKDCVFEAKLGTILQRTTAEIIQGTKFFRKKALFWACDTA